MSDTSRRAALRAQQEAQARAARTRKMVGLGAAIVVLIVAAVLMLSFVSSMGGGGGAVTPPHATSDRSGITIDADKAKPGAPDVQLFADYQCPGCAQFDDVFGSKLVDMAKNGDIKLTFRTRTFLDSNLRNTSSTDAARAAACADTVDAYSAYHLAVFEGQPKNEGDGYTSDQLRVQFPQKAGITGEKLTAFQSCYDKKATADFVKTMANANEKYVYAKVQENPNDKANQLWGSTPTLSVNGKRLDNSQLNISDPNSIATAITQLAG